MTAQMMYWTDEGALQDLTESLKQGKVSITATDTILGFLAPLTENGFNALNAAKGGRQNKPYLILIESPDSLPEFVDMASVNQGVRNLVTHCWPGPLTIVFKAKAGLPKHLIAPDGTVALRCPAHEGLRNLLISFNGLFSTSVNKSGKQPALEVDEIDVDIMQHVDCMVTDEQNVMQLAQASTIIDVSHPESGIKILRAGAYLVDELEQVYGWK